MAPEDTWPPCAEQSKLLYIVSTRPESYAKMLALIMLGASVPSAAMMTGISRKNLLDWRAMGLIDEAEGKDTIYSRFTSDINFAAIIPSIDAETAILRKDPLEWLRSGPGRWVHSREGTWQPPAVKVDQLPPPATAGIAENEESVEDQVDLMMDAPTVDDLPKALAVLRDSGLGHIIDAADNSEALKEPSTNGHDGSQKAPSRENNS